ncbi:TPA: hypothetical protein L5G01_002000 [Pseudomonas aeruginosa]|nr:hypothetical protein [Pseudomonas aeruginosa]HBO9897409.1 hypothetical protein [Pseudomonas aeruginosa]HBO9929725.1 hypothetical protein [Pseudomonas aeruginosa]
MTKSVNQERAPLASPSTTYVFQGPVRIAIRTRTNDQPRYVDTRSCVWTWYDGGIPMTVNWAELKLHQQFMEIAKGFMVHALEKYSPSTAYRVFRLYQRISESEIAFAFPWQASDIVNFSNKLSSPREYMIVFRALYRWAKDRGISGFRDDVYLEIKYLKTYRASPCSKIFLSQTGLKLDEEERLLKRIGQEALVGDWGNFQLNIILHLGFELAPRSIQFHSLDIADFEVIETSVHDKY